MSSLRLEDTMNTLFQCHIPISPAQNRRLARACVGILLASDCRFPKIARRLPSPVSQAGRVRFLQRLLSAPFVTQTHVYQPWLRRMVRGIQEGTWHLVIDRSTLEGYNAEWLLIGLAYRQHAIPLVWEVIDFGCTSAAEQIALWRRVLPLIPPDCHVIAHGDSEFGSVAVMRFLREQGWDFILGQAANTRYRHYGQADWKLLANLAVPKRGTLYLPRVEWTQQHRYGPLNVFAFYAPHQNSPESLRRDYRYCATTLPTTYNLRRLGRRRWSIECCFKDFKSAGWNIELSHIRHLERRDTLLTLLSMVYLWATGIGRWLCKVGKRREVDAHPTRHLSLFRIGWDWLVSQFSQGHDWPLVSTLYS